MFDDFKLMHNYLSISDMISIENDPTICKRAEFNKPYKCIKIEKMTSSAFIENMSIEKIVSYGLIILLLLKLENNWQISVIY